MLLSLSQPAPSSDGHSPHERAALYQASQPLPNALPPSPAQGASLATPTTPPPLFLHQDSAPTASTLPATSLSPPPTMFPSPSHSAELERECLSKPGTATGSGSATPPDQSQLGGDADPIGSSANVSPPNTPTVPVAAFEPGAWDACAWEDVRRTTCLLLGNDELLPIFVASALHATPVHDKRAVNTCLDLVDAWFCALVPVWHVGVWFVM
jgi:hypothetical protein